MQIAVITGPTYEVALTRILLANKLRDGVELRLDLFREFDIEKIEKLLKASQGKTIFTLRKRTSGGGFIGSEERRLDLLSKLFALQPDYIDLEFDTNTEFLASCTLEYPETKIITSYHNFEKTPKDLDLVLQRMLTPYSYAYKICTTANASSDSYKILRFVQKQVGKGFRMIGLALGEYGRITRKEGIKSGNYLNYTVLHNHDSCAPGIQFA
ncbi:MAG: type I 3-dehydroquinate dehydratase [Verrucomicrobia bacterium]|nr:type I 3-dehydroquinate dehydratase [Verrucomicrobiota bacterium]